MTIDYGQRAAKAESAAASEVCRALGIHHELIAIDCSSLGSGDLTFADPNSLAPASDWWPYRNQLLVTLACMKAVARDIQTMFIATVRSDGESHQDGTPAFITRINDLVAMQEGGLRIVAPAIALTTAELVRMADVPPGLLAWSHSCHKADVACGNCRGCNKYWATFQELGEPYAPHG